MEAMIQEMEAAQVLVALCIVHKSAAKTARARTLLFEHSTLPMTRLLQRCSPSIRLSVVCKQVPWTRQTFNGIMNAYAEQGNTQRCRELCKRMEQEDIPPDEVTFSTILRSYAYVPRPPSA